MKIGIGVGINYITNSAIANYLAGAMVWGFKSKFKWSQTSTDIWGFANPNDIDPESQVVYDRIIADGGVSDLTRLNYFVVGLKTIYGSLTNVPVCYDAHWIGYKLGSGTGATAGQAAAKLYSLTVAGDAVQTTAASQPLLLAHNGASSDNYWFSPLSVTDNCSTPNAVANQIIGDVEFIFNFSFYSVANANFISKRSGGSNVSYAVNTQFQGKPILTITQNGSTLITATSSTAITTATNWLKVIRTQSSGDVIFYTSTDGVTYTQLGTTQSTTSGNMFNGTSALTLGNNAVNGGDGMGGKMFRATIANSIGGTPVVDFNPATYNASTSQTQWTSATGEVWTINTGTAATGYKGVLVDRTIVQADGVDDRLENSTNLIGLNDAFSIYTSFKSYLMAAAQYPCIFGQGADPGAGVQKNVMFIAKRFTIATASLGTDIYSPSGVDTPPDATLNLINFSSLRISNWSTHRTNGLTKINKNTNSLTVSSYGALNPSSPLDTSGFALFSLKTPVASSMNGVINTFILDKTYDSDSINTAMYNFIKTLNNNAF